MGGQISGPGHHVLAGQLAEGGQGFTEPFVLGIDHGVRPIGGDHPAGPAGLADAFVMLQPVVGAFGGGQQFDAEGGKGGRHERGRRAAAEEVGNLK